LERSGENDEKNRLNRRGTSLRLCGLKRFQ
jgi:hypothetical protein